MWLGCLGYSECISFLHWIMEVALLLSMLGQLSFRTGSGGSTLLILQAHKITFSYLDLQVLAVLSAAALLHYKGKESISISSSTCCRSSCQSVLSSLLVLLLTFWFLTSELCIFEMGCHSFHHYLPYTGSD